ncbi:hypothetical protein [Parasitella parasitica]|uniref:Uncharacterized protein n=1 Tax=Parasitella parasitica TaxID=35722 RepID=A0A0B7N0T8_9FUNG|nr:hypothetical protein [Parasitella parasitica]
MGDLISNAENKLLFGNVVKSDKFCVDFLFYRRTAGINEDSALIKSHDLRVDDFLMDETVKFYRPSFLDPGWKSVFTAVTGFNYEQHHIRRCSVKEYYHLTGSTAYSARLRLEKDVAEITPIESATSTAKTGRCTPFLRFASHMLSHMNKLCTFYGFHTAKSRFNLYQGRQRAPEMMVNKILNGGTK